MPLIGRIRGTISNRVRGRLNSSGGSAASLAQHQQQPGSGSSNSNAATPRGGGSTVPPEVELVSATSSDGQSLDDSDSYCSAVYQPYESALLYGSLQHPKRLDPYWDVRARLHVLASQDRARHALHARGGGGEEGYESDASTDAVVCDRSSLKSLLAAAAKSSSAARRREAAQAQASRASSVKHEEPQIPWLIAYTCYLGYAVLILLGHVRDFCALLFGGRFRKKVGAPRGNGYPSEDRSRYASLLKSWEHFYTRRLYTRIQDCFNRPIASRPAASAIDVVERVSRNGQKSMQLYGPADQPGTVDTYCSSSSSYFVTTYDGVVARRCLNLGSYNYLGFADDWHATCSRAVKATLAEFPVSAASSLAEYGRTDLHDRMEEAVAKFVGKEDAICLNMGFNTNATTIPALAGPGDLVISDELNHTSIVNGARASGAAIRIFRHNDMDDLEDILREAIIMGKPRTRRPWNKIVVMVEGIYSMEGAYSDLKNVVRLCKKYGAYVYLDEAHSIGAMGLTGRGCAEYAGVDPADIDIMMGTFTKSFGAMGGYIAASRETITFLRKRCAGSVFHNSLSPVVCQQVLSALKVISGEDGTSRGRRKLQALRDNSNYFRMRLKEMGLHVLGHYDSPVIPVMLYNPTKIGAFSRECFKRGLAVVVVGFPAVPILMSRVRFCISAGHARADLDRALREIDEIADIVKIRYGRRSPGAAP